MDDKQVDNHAHLADEPMIDATAGSPTDADDDLDGAFPFARTVVLSSKATLERSLHHKIGVKSVTNNRRFQQFVYEHIQVLELRERHKNYGELHFGVDGCIYLDDIDVKEMVYMETVKFDEDGSEKTFVVNYKKRGKGTVTRFVVDQADEIAELRRRINLLEWTNTENEGRIQELQEELQRANDENIESDGLIQDLAERLEWGLVEDYEKDQEIEALRRECREKDERIRQQDERIQELTADVQCALEQMDYEGFVLREDALEDDSDDEDVDAEEEIDEDENDYDEEQEENCPTEYGRQFVPFEDIDARPLKNPLLNDVDLDAFFDEHFPMDADEEANNNDDDEEANNNDDNDENLI